jgi:hypothetical protein
MNKIELCKLIQANVNKLAINELIELFKIIKESDSSYTKNNNGIFLNLNWLDEEILLKINNYISFCIKSQNEINKYEIMKTLLNSTSLTIKDNDATNSNAVIDVVENSNNISRQKFSSSMKFYLLKKKFMKHNTITINILENELKYEDYVIT